MKKSCMKNPEIKCMKELSADEIKSKFERDPFMKAKITAYVRESSASKRNFNTYSSAKKRAETPKTLKERLDV